MRFPRSSPDCCTDFASVIKAEKSRKGAIFPEYSRKYACKTGETMVYLISSGKPDQRALIAQLVEQVTLNHWVLGSSPRERTIFFALTSPRVRVQRREAYLYGLDRALVQRGQRRVAYLYGLDRALVQRGQRRKAYLYGLDRALVQRGQRRVAYLYSLDRAFVQRGQRRERM